MTFQLWLLQQKYCNKVKFSHKLLGIWKIKKNLSRKSFQYLDENKAPLSVTVEAEKSFSNSNFKN